ELSEITEQNTNEVFSLRN
ncbi:MAG: hypothetical protein ACKVJP_02135, partial [Flavobacteriales bacterium]